MTGVELVGLAASVSLLAGWRLYLCTFAVGVAMRLGMIALPDHLSGLAVLANPWIIGISAVGLIAEFFADKIMWLDSAWDGVHTFIRPVGGALLALAIVDADDTGWQVACLLLGGGGTLLTHSVKGAVRVVVNASPEPFSNFLLSSAEDLLTLVLLYLAIRYPVAAIVIAVLMLAVAIWALILLRRALAGLWRRAGRRWRAQPHGDAGP